MISEVLVWNRLYVCWQWWLGGTFCWRNHGDVSIYRWIIFQLKKNIMNWIDSQSHTWGDRYIVLVWFGVITLQTCVWECQTWFDRKTLCLAWRQCKSILFQTHVWLKLCFGASAFAWSDSDFHVLFPKAIYPYYPLCLLW
jgi:hypothetical protein